MEQYSLFDTIPDGKINQGRRDFLVVPWNTNFLRVLLDEAVNDCDGDISRAAFIFPHSRPEKYLTRLLRGDDRIRRPLIMPDFFTINGLFSSLARQITGTTAWEAGMLDQVGLLLECVRAETADANLFQVLPGVAHNSRGLLDEARQFFPWGIRLASLFEECFTQGCTPKNFQYVDEQVTPFAARLLERLAGIYSRYRAGLAARQWSTPGLNAAIVADHLAGRGHLPPFVPEGANIYIAGFHTLTETEDAVFRHIWQECGARIILHADPGLIDGEGHWSCEPLKQWAMRWKARMLLTGIYEEKKQYIRYIEGFDLHSQLAVLEEELAESGTSETKTSESDAPSPENHEADTAVILPDNGLLLPVLHHLPHTDINISMGYPLERSSLFRLLDTILRAQENRRGETYYWRDLIELVRHPYLKMLSSGIAEGEEEILPPGPGFTPIPQEENLPKRGDLRRMLGEFEKGIRAYSSSYLNPFELLEIAASSETAPKDADSVTMARQVLQCALSTFENPRTAKDVGVALDGLCRFLLDYGGTLWDRFLIDAECLYRLIQSVIPELTQSALAEEEFTVPTLFTLTRQLLNAQRVPFEATPLVGLQVMGLLEARLLTFKRVFVVDATEDRLPGSSIGDPLLPGSLRPELGLPPPHSGETVTAYHFFRLVNGADEVALLWQNAPESPGIQDAKKKKSRFVEELLWQEEKQRGKLFEKNGTDENLTVLSASIAPMRRNDESLPVTKDIRALIANLLKRPVSASLLDSYLSCPLRFFYERMSGLAPAEEITEGEDPLNIGKLLHQTLQDFYTPLLNRELPSGDSLDTQEFEELHEELMATLRAQSIYGRLSRNLPADSFAMLKTAAELRLKNYLKNQPLTRVLALETKIQVNLAIDLPLPEYPALSGITLTGVADRIDLRPRIDISPGEDDTPSSRSSIHILDYKTGVPSAPSFGLWSNDSLWRRMETWTLGTSSQAEGIQLLSSLAGELKSVQLPLYLLLFSQGDVKGVSQNAKGALLDAAWVTLGGEGKEVPLFPLDLSAAKRNFITTRQIPELISFLLRHMCGSDTIFPLPGKHCDWCFRANSCRVPQLP